MQPHQQRVVDEVNELSDKHDKLIAFIESNQTFQGLESQEQTLLRAQVGAMRAYLEILNLRIAAFGCE